jgi:hypothetical protein
MKHQPHFESVSKPAMTETDRIRAMIADLGRTVRILDSEVAIEEERCGISDRSDAQYPMLARTAAARSENLRATIAALEMRLTSVARAKATTTPQSWVRKLRRNASRRRLEAWLRLKSSADHGSSPLGQV